MSTKIQESDSEEFYRHLFNSAGEGMVIVNRLGHIITANARTTELFGYELEELISQGVGMLIPENVRPHHHSYISDYFKNPRVRMMSESSKLYGRKKDGSNFPVEISLTYFKTKKDLFSIALISDITQRKADEKKILELNDQLQIKVEERTVQLDQSEKLYSTIAENFPDGSISVLDNELNYVFTEGRELKKQGIKTKTILGTAYLARFNTKDADRIRKHFHGVFQGTPTSYDFELNNAFYDADAVPLENINGEIEQVLVFEKNVTRKKIAEEEIKNSLEKERELNILKSRFVSMASHEFRTPLAAILSSVSLIGKYTKEDQQQNRDKHITRIKSSIHNLTTILNDFLSLDKLETGKV
ncbi:MAG: PAS domain-containing sensor histidine kinase, partial [Flavobacteriales bacterium]